MRRLRRWIVRLGALGLGAALVGATALWLAVVLVPFPVAELAPTAVEARRIRDRYDRLLRVALSDAEARGAWVALADVSPWVAKAFVAIEDRRFYDHHGVDPRGVARAARDNWRAGRTVAGGSTITQQVVQLLRPTPRSIGGKAREALWALRLERAVDKATILEQYVNRAPFGNGTIGVEAAARRYLGQSAASLSLAEAALLAGIPRAPSRNNPFADPARARRRQREVLDQLLAVGAIDASAHREALAEPLRLVERGVDFAAPHFAAWVLAQGAGVGDVRTTLDLDLQQVAEALVARTVRALGDRRVGQGAAVVLDNRTGDILAWVGSADFYDPRGGQVDMVVGLRQPGSTLKPFVYGLGFERGVDERTRLPDVPIFFATALGDYRPRNYDRKYHGWVSPRAALANSYNVPAVWMAERVGVGVLLERLRALGFASLDHDASYYGLGLALGNGEVRLLELANAYRTLANEGRAGPVRWEVDAPIAPTRPLMPAPVARLVTDILADPVARVPAFGRENALDLPFRAAAKTGTSTDFTDNWTVGYTDSVTVAVWVGNFDGRPMESVSGVTGAGPLWNALMRAAMRGRPAPAFSTAGLTRGRLCRDTGALWTPACGHAVDGWFVGPVAGPRPPPRARRLRVSYPDDGDVFTLDPDVPLAYAQLKLRAEAPADGPLVWAIDGAQQTGGAALWWTPTPGTHTAQVWLAAAPEAPSAAVTFEVIAPTP